MENPTYEDERPPQEFIDALKILLVHHESYIWTFPRIKNLIEDRKKTLESYGTEPNDRVRLQSTLLLELSKAEKLISVSSRLAISDLEESVDTIASIGIGPDAVQYGLLRGALQSMGRILVQVRRIGMQTLTHASTHVVSTALSAAVITSPLFPPIVQFFQSNLAKLLQLASSAQDWSWLRLVTSFIHHVI